MAVLAPVIFVIHVAEERSGFVAWFNQHVARGITPDLFWTVNLAGLAITVALTAVLWMSPTRGSALAMLGWLSLLFAANGIFHVAAAVLDGRYAPGAISAALLYLPFYIVYARATVRLTNAPASAAVVAVLGATPMLLHGYLILFRGSRLF
jgi:hypothetical protein